MIRRHAVSQSQPLCKHLQRLLPATEGAHPAEQSRQGGAHSSLYTVQCASTAAQLSSHDQVTGPRLDVDAPLPRFLPQSGKPEEAKSIRQPVAVQQAIQEVQAHAKARFDETVEIAINLGTNPKRGDQAVRGTALLPFGTGKSLRIAAFAEGEDAIAATAAGADVVGGEELIQQIQASGSSSLNFDKAVAVPAIMPKLSKLARLLGPRGLMPNPKLGTLSTDIKEAIRQLKTGKVEFRADRGAVLHAGVGKASFTPENLHSNLGALCFAVLSARPKGVKGSGMSGYFLKASLTSTMGRSVPVSLASLSQAATAYRASQR
ncbi:hypothetical protein ABBQ38_009702 [Trebouxia sp. C0009 RCD-2024]